MHPRCRTIDHTRNTGISSTPIPPLDFRLSFSSRSRRALSRCLTSARDVRGSWTGLGFRGGDGSRGVDFWKRVEEGGFEGFVERGFVSRDDDG